VLCCAQPSAGAPPVRDKAFTVDFSLYFRLDKIALDSTYLDNPAQMAALRAFFSQKQVQRLDISAWASPEGPFKHNVWLSDRRSRAAAAYVLQHSALTAPQLQLHPLEENWDGLRAATRLKYAHDNREDVLRILETPGIPDQERKRKLMALDGGETYRFLIDTLMGPLRLAHMEVTWTEPLAWIPSRTVVPFLPAAPQFLPSPRRNPEAWAKRTVVAFKTNLLYDAVTALNYGVEVPLNARFSLVWEHYFPWWHTKKELRYCLQYLTLGGEGRWWFAPQTRPESDRRVQRDALMGHFLGVYGKYGKMDLQWNRAVGMYQCAPAWSAGVTYGYAMPISRHLNLEFSLSVGYARIPYQHYIPSEDWQHLWRDRDNTGVLHYFGPTQLQVSLVWPILVKYRVK